MFVNYYYICTDNNDLDIKENEFKIICTYY